MKKLFRLSVVILILSIYSCADDSNTPGTSGPTDSRNSFAGSWTCAEAGGQTFSITISLHGSEDSIYINNFSNYGSSANALGLVSGNSLTIPAQNISISSIYIQGSGVLNSAGNKITMNYISDADTISAICTKN